MESISDSQLRADYTEDLTKALNLQESPTTHVLGHVADAFEMPNGAFAAQLVVSTDNKPLLTGLLSTGVLGNVSLTHVVANGVAVPLEVSLVHSPARPMSKIVHIAADANTSSLYKAQLVAGSTFNHIMSANVPATTPLSCADALKAVPEMHRKIIAARMAELVRNADASNTKSAALEQKLEDSQRHVQMDQQILEGQLKQVLGYLDPKVRSTYGFPGDIAECMKMFDPTDAGKMGHATLRTLMCCNQAMMEMQMQQRSTAAVPVAAAAVQETTDSDNGKRQRVEETPAAQMEVEDVATVSAGDDSPLARALFATFN